ncbi:hypothetical protein B1T45_27470 [Mycobacterium kansasii]|uniref:Uncharacterized protein n=2 Tax=Mycobacterium kansasii TaxID=1768 RepID=A0A7G1ID56_MYCKA|nr:hypothetical protein B1T45_27470 [Mycobacterium kansasii]ETZ97183.1 hypothetical protein I547_7325 [Mycobacterium kansasii 824]EUA07902.1 hypothetical protein I545_6310 [Mycobacterium kansasii 662]ARG71999.1 hypothetical protein B1T47_26865 [Mycobacterium kansasii]ARG73503.1 hypothetical protein B1T51_01990 [Mycobacterium kansasii]
MIHRVRDTITLLTFNLALVSNRGETLLATPIPIQQILSSSTLIDSQLRSPVVQIAGLVALDRADRTP